MGYGWFIICNFDKFIIFQILFVIACHTSYINYYIIWTAELFSVNSPNMFTIQIVMHVYASSTYSTLLKINRYYDGSSTMSASNL